MRYYYNSKATVEESCDVSIFQLKRWGMLSGCNYMPVTWKSSMTGKETSIGLTVDITTDNPYARFVYTAIERDGNKTDYDYEVSLVTTPCTFGGVRYWFGCPMCGRRVGCLYLVRAGYFMCRHCNNLSYRSRNRCTLEAFGYTSRQIDEFRSQIKRWTWRGRPTRKMRRLQALERKMGMLSGPIRARMEKFKARLQ